MKIKQCIILAGGLGTRLGSLTKKTPKPLIKINNIPFIIYLISKLKKEGIKKIIILTWSMSNQFNKINFKKIFNIDIKIIKEKKKLGTGGSIINSYKFLDSLFFLVNGDTIFDISLMDLEKKYLSSKKASVITACHLSNKSKNKYAYFFNIRKNLYDYKLSRNKKNWVSGGTYILKKKILRNYPKIELDLDKEIIFNEFQKNKLIAEKYFKPFIDIGTKSDLKKASKFITKLFKKNFSQDDKYENIIN